MFAKMVFPEGWRVHFLEWEEPLKDETMMDYARRLSSGIDTSTPFVLAGVSFGGMIAQDIATFLQPRYLILLSTFQHHSEFPFSIRYCRSRFLLPVVKLFIPSRTNFIMNYLFCVKTKEERQVLDDSFRTTSTAFSKWAIEALVCWKTQSSTAPRLVIHGSTDRIIPVKSVHPHYVVEGAGHLMLYSHAEEVSSYIQQSECGRA